MTMPDNTSITQMGYVVADLDAAMERWKTTVGAGPFERLNHVEVVDGLYRGTPTNVDISVAIAEVGTDGRVCFTNSANSETHVIIDQLINATPETFTRPAASGAKRLTDTRLGRS